MNQQFYLGLSTNHKVTQEHAEFRFRNQYVTLTDIVEHIKGKGVLYPPITQGLYYEDCIFCVQKAFKFTQTPLVPFDLDMTKCRMEDYLDKLPYWLRPTIAFKTRNNNDGDGIFKFRFLYLFDTPIVTREMYYSTYETIKREIEKYTNGDFGEDQYAYGLVPDSKSNRGNCCKPIRTKPSSEIVVREHIFSLSEFDVQQIFFDLDYDTSERIDQTLFSQRLYDSIMKQGCYLPDSYYRRRFENYSVTRTEFHKGFAFVRGNLNFAQFIRKFTFDKATKSYQPSKWEVGQGRHKKLRMDGFIARFNFYKCIGEQNDISLNGDELFQILYQEARDWFEIKDKNNNDVISRKFIMEVVTEVLNADISNVIAIVHDYNQKIDAREKRKRQLIRLDINYWKRFVPYSSYKKEIGKMCRRVARVLKILNLYDENKTKKENIALFDTLDKDIGFPSYGEEALGKFISDCKLIYKKITTPKIISESEIRDLLFSNEGFTATPWCMSFENYASLFVSDNSMIEKLATIAQNSLTKYWSQVKEGIRDKPKNGRPCSSWQEQLVPLDAKLPLKELYAKVELLSPNIPYNSVKTWKHRTMKKLAIASIG